MQAVMFRQDVCDQKILIFIFDEGSWQSLELTVKRSLFYNNIIDGIEKMLLICKVPGTLVLMA